MTWRQPAGVMLRSSNSKSVSTSSAEASQRLHAEDLNKAYLVEKTCKFKISRILLKNRVDRVPAYINIISGGFNNLYSSFKRISFSSYSTYNYRMKLLHPAWVSGFTDGEGCFIVSTTKNKNLKLGWQVQLYFQISLHNKDLELMTEIKNFFGVGSINRLDKRSIQFRATSLKDLIIIIKHFETFPLITDKCADFELFKKAFKLIEQKEHLTLEGLRKIFAIKASMNRGISELKSEVPVINSPLADIVPVQRAQITNKIIYDSNWLAGFSSAEGCFFVKIKNSVSHSLGFQVELVFKLTQHIRGEILMKNILNYLECGNIYIYRKAIDFQVTKFNQIIDIIIPLFQKYPIVGVKALDFANWCEVVELIKEKKHLTEEGLEKIRKIKKGMNKGREEK